MSALAAIPKYEVYKESGVDWLGTIPSDWDTRRIKFVFSETNERSKDGSEELLSVSQYTGVTKKSDKLAENDLLTNAETLEGYKKVAQGELVSNIMLAWNGSLGFSSFDGIVSPAYSVYRLLGDNNQRYFHYLLRTDAYKAEYKRRSSGVIESRLRLYTNDFFDTRSLLPPVEEQVAIAYFLDQKTTQIDEAISIKEKQIALLKERKQIIIQKAVTQGLNPDVPMKDSGVDWVGQIPEYWEVKKLKFISTYFKGFAFKSDDFSDTGVPIVKAGNIKEHSVSNIQTFIANDNQRREFEKFRLSTGDVVVSTVGSKPEITNSAVGQLCSIDSEYNESYLNQNTVCIRPHRKLDNRFLKYVFASKYVRNEFDRKALWIANQAYLEVDEILDILISIPELGEQSSISDYLDSQAVKFSKAIDSQLQQIEKLKEYKTTLINSAVTGKIKVA